LSEPGHGHCIEQTKTASICFEATIVCEKDQSACNTMQNRYSSPFIFNTLDKLSKVCKTGDLPTMQGYYAYLSEPNTPNSEIQAMQQHENIVSTLKQRARLQIAGLQFSWHFPEHRYILHLGWFVFEKRVDSSQHFSDRVSVHSDILIAVNYEFRLSAAMVDIQPMSPTLPIPNDMNSKLNP
jgi:hypothetical protein